MQWLNAEFTLTDDRAALDVTYIHAFLTTSYWAQGVPLETVIRSLDNSLCFGLWHDGRQIGFGRAVTDRATFAYLADVFIDPDYRGRGLGKWLVTCILAHPELQGLRRWLLGTRDAHALYRKLGFVPLRKPEIFMEIRPENVYGRNV